MTKATENLMMVAVGTGDSRNGGAAPELSRELPRVLRPWSSPSPGSVPRATPGGTGREPPPAPTPAPAAFRSPEARGGDIQPQENRDIRPGILPDPGHGAGGTVQSPVFPPAAFGVLPCLDPLGTRHELVRAQLWELRGAHGSRNCPVPPDPSRC